jgi:hypothetical protein
MRLSATSLALAALLGLSGWSPVTRAATPGISDPQGDFLSTFAGSRPAPTWTC